MRATVVANDEKEKTETPRTPLVSFRDKRRRSTLPPVIPPGADKDRNFSSPTRWGVALRTINDRKYVDRVRSILSTFKFFRDMDPTVLQRLPQIATHVKHSTGVVVFRQGDPPGNCYVVLSGEVGIFVKSEDDECPAEPDQRNKNLKRQNSQALMEPRLIEQASAIVEAFKGGNVVWRPRTGPFQSRIGASGTGVDVTLRAGKAPILRTKTAEGHSTYNEGSNLGKLVASVKAGSLFGELALQRNQPRAASAKCLTNSEFLSISRVDFDSILKGELTKAEDEKAGFLREHVPGMRDLPQTRFGSGKLHPSDFFKKYEFPKDHEFLTQGVSSEDSIFVVFEGCVEFRFQENGPCSQSERGGSRLRSLSPQRRRGAAASPGHGTGDSAVGGTTGSAGTVRKMGMLLKGGIFGALPLQEPEPFTVAAASSPCEVLCILGSDVARLPRQLINQINDYFVSSVMWRLARLQSGQKLLKAYESLSSRFLGNTLEPKMPKSAKEYGAKLVKAGKLHPHPLLLRGLVDDQHILSARRPCIDGPPGGHSASAPLLPSVRGTARSYDSVSSPHASIHSSASLATRMVSPGRGRRGGLVGEPYDEFGSEPGLRRSKKGHTARLGEWGRCPWDHV